jgi:ADP-ribose pyrophosphatase YjhB (NUDIX family)
MKPAWADLRHCPQCGAAVESRIPHGDDRERAVCSECEHIAYVNPKVIVGSVCFSGERLLLCRRAIEPRKGYWTIPAGFMELGETAEEGAMREAREEANADIEIEALLATYSVRHVGQVQLLYLARLLNDDIAPGLESLDVMLCRFDEIPWHDLAFPTVEWALSRARLVKDSGEMLLPESNPAGAEPIRGGA